MKRILFAALSILALGISAGCHAQVPPPSKGSNVALTWTAPVAGGSWAGCTIASPCVYAVYAEAVSGLTCDPTTSANYKEITSASTRPSGTSFTDTAASGLTKCYDVETVQGSQNSGPSNVAGPIVAPGAPLAPALGTPSLADVVRPALPLPSVNGPQNPGKLKAKLTR